VADAKVADAVVIARAVIAIVAIVADRFEKRQAAACHGDSAVVRRFRLMRARIIAAVAFATTCASMSTAHATPVDLEVGFGGVAPYQSAWRASTDYLGYGVGITRLSYEIDTAAMFVIPRDFGLGASALSIGPVLRGHWAHLYAPYAGVDPIDAVAAFTGVRQELRLLGFPRLYLWLDETLGGGSVGQPRGHSTSLAYGIRGGLAFNVGTDDISVRVLAGYSYSESFRVIAPGQGLFEWGGFVFGLEGYFRARH